MSDTLDTFLDSLSHAAPPPGASGLLLAVWHGLKGEWEAAHAIAQDHSTAQGAWVHGWLHRIEGDLGNARYWYGEAGKSPATDSIRLEGERIVTALLADGRAGP